MYKLVKPIPPNAESKMVLRLSDNAYIPMDEANIDYQQCLAWIAQGNQPLPADEVSK